MNEASCTERRCVRFRHFLKFIISASYAQAVRCGYAILRGPWSIELTPLGTFRLVCDETGTDGLCSPRLPSTAKTLIRFFSWSGITYEKLHSNQKNCFHCHFHGLSRSELRLQKVVTQFFSNWGTHSQAQNWFNYIFSEWPSSWSWRREAWQESHMFVSTACKNTLRCFQKRHTVSFVWWQKCVSIRLRDFKEFWDFPSDEIEHGRERERTICSAGVPVTGLPSWARVGIRLLIVPGYMSRASIRELDAALRLKSRGLEK